MNWKEVWSWIKIVLMLLGFGVIMLIGMKLRYDYDKSVIKNAIIESQND